MSKTNNFFPSRRGWIMLTCSFSVASLTLRIFLWSCWYAALAAKFSTKSTSKSFNTSGRNSSSGQIVSSVNQCNEVWYRLEGSLISSPSGVPTKVNFLPGTKPSSELARWLTKTFTRHSRCTYIRIWSGGNFPLTKPRIFCRSNGTLVNSKRDDLRSKTLFSQVSMESTLSWNTRPVWIGNLQCQNLSCPREL